MNLIEHWNHHKSGTFADNASRLAYARHWTRDNIKSNLFARRYQFWRDSHAYSLATLKNLRRERLAFAKDFAHAVKTEDSTYALELLREYPRIIRHGSASDLMMAKFGGDYYHCDDCDEIHYFDDTRTVNQGDRRVCYDCRDNNYHWSDYFDGYVDSDYEHDNQSEPEFQNIGEYHSSSDNLGRIPSKYDQRKPRVLLGMELEMEIDTDYDMDTRAGKLLSAIGDYRAIDGARYIYALCEQDGSLDNGFEMVTAYTGLDVHKEQLQFFKERFEGATSHNTSTCGLHVHICKADMTTLHACKMVLFINDADNQKLVYALARRDATSYAKIHDKKNDKHWMRDAVQSGKTISERDKQKRHQLRNINSDRYEALNFKNDKTIEFRLFKGTLKYQTIMACLEFTFATWHFCRDAGQSDLTTAKFLEFICRAENRTDTRFLRTYLKEKGFTLPEKISKAKPNGSLEKIARETAPMLGSLSRYDEFGVNLDNSFNTELA